MFLWADAGVDSEGLAAAGHEAGFLLTPGSLFSPHQSPTTWMRFNIANCGDPALPGCSRAIWRRPRGAAARCGCGFVCLGFYGWPVFFFGLLALPLCGGGSHFFAGSQRK